MQVDLVADLHLSVGDPEEVRNLDVEAILVFGEVDTKMVVGSHLQLDTHLVCYGAVVGSRHSLNLEGIRRPEACLKIMGLIRLE